MTLSLSFLETLTYHGFLWDNPLNDEFWDDFYHCRTDYVSLNLFVFCFLFVNCLLTNPNNNNNFNRTHTFSGVSVSPANDFTGMIFADSSIQVFLLFFLSPFSH